MLFVLKHSFVSNRSASFIVRSENEAGQNKSCSAIQMRNENNGESRNEEKGKKEKRKKEIGERLRLEIKDLRYAPPVISRSK